MRLLSVLPVFLCLPFLSAGQLGVREPAQIETISATSADTQQDNSINLESYPHWSGNNSTPVRFTTFVARSPEDWERLWSNIGMKAPNSFPSNRIAIGIMLGERPSEGYNVRVSSLRNVGGALKVVYIETKPANPQAARKVTTSPWVVMLAPQTEGSVRFIPQSMAGN